MDNLVVPADAREELLDQCESIWRQMEECQSKLTLLGKESILNSDGKLSLLMMRVKGLLEEHNRWQKKRPEVVSASPDVLLALGKEELQKVKSDLEMLLSTLQSKNKRLEEDLKREQQWYEEQQQILCILNKIEEEAKNQVNQRSSKRLKKASLELKNKTLKVKFFKEHLLNGLCEFLEQHFPLPEKGGIAEKKKFRENPSVELITLQEILEMRNKGVVKKYLGEIIVVRCQTRSDVKNFDNPFMRRAKILVVQAQRTRTTISFYSQILINKIISTPHEPYVAIRESFWPPYIEMLLRCGIALRHPEDPNRIRLEAFHM